MIIININLLRFINTLYLLIQRVSQKIPTKITLYIQLQNNKHETY